MLDAVVVAALESLGMKALEELRRIASYATLTVLAAAAAATPREGRRIVRGLIARQIVFTGWDGVPFVAFMGGVIAVSTIAVSATLLPSGQTPELIAKVLTFVLVREIAPAVTAIVVIMRSCSAIVVELGYMSTRGEIEAIEMLGIDPARFVLLPRFCGMIVAQVVLTAVFVAAAFGVGLATAAAFGVAPSFGGFDDLAHRITSFDVIVALVKAIVSGTIVAAVACYHGLSVGRDITETPRRTTRALMEALVHTTAISAVITLVTV